MATLLYAAKFDPFLPFLGFRPHALYPGAIQGKEGIKFCHLATLQSRPQSSYQFGGEQENGRQRAPPTKLPLKVGHFWQSTFYLEIKLLCYFIFLHSALFVLTILDVLVSPDLINEQGDHSGCAKPPVNIKTKVPF